MLETVYVNAALSHMHVMSLNGLKDSDRDMRILKTIKE
jgi:hypothetical protein